MEFSKHYQYFDSSSDSSDEEDFRYEDEDDDQFEKEFNLPSTRKPNVDTSAMEDAVAPNTASNDLSAQSNIKESPTTPSTNTKDTSMKEEDPLYGEDIDERDQRWVIQTLYPPGIGGKHQSDAVLNCPCCFTLLCLDCQRHERYHNQYRAMFVRNCITNHHETLKYEKDKPTKPKNTKKSKSKKTEEAETDFDVYHPVHCEVCNTEVGVMDQDEVYHFFNVFPSQA